MERFVVSRERKIIGLMAQDARRTLAEIGAKVDLSPSAVNERIRRLTASRAILQSGPNGGLLMD